MHETHHDTVDARRIAVSNHAELRAMQRLGVIEGTADVVRDLLERAEQVDTYGYEGVLWRAGDVLIITDRAGSVVQTVLRDWRGAR